MRDDEVVLKPWVCPKCRKATEIGWFVIHSDGTFECIDCVGEDDLDPAQDEAEHLERIKRELEK